MTCFRSPRGMRGWSVASRPSSTGRNSMPVVPVPASGRTSVSRPSVRVARSIAARDGAMAPAMLGEATVARITLAGGPGSRRGSSAFRVPSMPSFTTSARPVLPAFSQACASPPGAPRELTGKTIASASRFQGRSVRAIETRSGPISRYGRTRPARNGGGSRLRTCSAISISSDWRADATAPSGDESQVRRAWWRSDAPPTPEASPARTPRIQGRRSSVSGNHFASGRSGSGAVDRSRTIARYR